MIVLLLLLALQDQPRELIEKLTSDDPILRDAAAKKLAELGKAAEPELRKAVGHPDPEVAGRIRKLLRNLEIDGALSARIKAAMPGIVARLQSGDGHEWTAALLETQRLASFVRSDLEYLAPPALRGAQNDQERMQLLALVQTRQVRSASAEVEALLSHSTLYSMAAPALVAARGRAAIPALVKAAQGGLPGPRIQALASLSGLGATEALAEIRDLVNCNDPQVRERAAQTYAQIAGREALPILKKMAADRDPVVRSTGLSGLAAMTLPEVGPEILAAFDSPDATVRVAAANAAGALRLRGAIPHLKALLQDPREELHLVALNALERYGTREAAKAIVPLLHDKDKELQEEALRALGEIRLREGVPEIVKLLDSKDDERREEAMRLLGLLGATEAFDRVAQGLKDDSEDVRTTTVYALGAIDPARASRLLVPFLTSERHGSDVKEWLAESRPFEAKAELEKLLAAEKDEKRREEIQETIENAFGASQETLLARLEDKEASARIRALEELRSADVTPLVIKRLKDADPGVRFAAVQALTRFESKELQAALADPDAEVLCEAIRGVSVLKIKESIPALLPLLKSPVTPVCQEAAEALGALGATEAVPGLVDLAKSAFPYVRASAARALRALNSPDGSAALQALLQDPHPYVRRVSGEVRETATLPQDRLAAVRAMTNAADLLAMLEDSAHDVVDAAVARLVAIGTKEAVVGAARAVDFRYVGAKLDLPREARVGLLELLNDPDERIRERGAAALSVLGAKEAIPKLTELLGGRSPEVMIETLADLDAREAAPRIAGFLAHHAGSARAAAATALGTLHATEAEPGLLELLDDPVAEVRRAAALALAELGSRNAVPKLIELLADEDLTAAAALCLLGRREGIPVILSAADRVVRLRGDLLARGHHDSEGPSFLTALNALRMPELRSALEKKSLSLPVNIGLADVAKAVAGDAGLLLDKDAYTGDLSYWGFRHYRRGSLWHVLFSSATSPDRIISEGNEPEVILEEGKIRLVDFDAAVRFWKAWSRK